MSLDFKEFVEAAIKTESKPGTPVNEQLLFLLLSCIYEFGELSDLFKKAMFQNRQIDSERIIDCCGRVQAHLEMFVEGHKHLNDPSYDAGIEVHSYKKSDEDTPEDVHDLPPNAINMRLAHAIVGDTSENGELAKALLNSIVDGTPIDRVNVGEEYADKDWYKALAFDELNLDEEASRRAVIAKLALRYKGGFSAAKSENRDTEAERVVLADMLKGQ